MEEVQMNVEVLKRKGKDEIKRQVAWHEVVQSYIRYVWSAYCTKERHWFSGKISRCHRDAPGSIPGWRKHFCLHSLQTITLTRLPISRITRRLSLRDTPDNRHTRFVGHRHAKDTATTEVDI